MKLPLPPSYYRPLVKVGQLCRPWNSSETLRLMRVQDGIATVRREDGTTRQEPLWCLASVPVSRR